MTKTAIVTITNLYDPSRSTKVKNFSDENIKEAICKLLLLVIEPKDLQCESSSMSGGLYSLKSKRNSLKRELKPIEGLRESVLIQVSYGDLYE